MENINKEGFQGLAFGMMDGTITALGVLMGLSPLEDKIILFIGILVTGMADSFANAAGVHVSEETETIHRRAEIWKSTLYCFFATILMFMLISLPVLLLPFETAVCVSWIIGTLLLVMLSVVVADIRKMKRLNLIAEYVTMGLVVSAVCYILSTLVKNILL